MEQEKEKKKKKKKKSASKTTTNTSKKKSTKKKSTAKKPASKSNTKKKSSSSKTSTTKKSSNEASESKVKAAPKKESVSKDTTSSVPKKESVSNSTTSSTPKKKKKKAKTTATTSTSKKKSSGKKSTAKKTTASQKSSTTKKKKTSTSTNTTSKKKKTAKKKKTSNKSGVTSKDTVFVDDVAFTTREVNWSIDDMKALSSGTKDINDIIDDSFNELEPSVVRDKTERVHVEAIHSIDKPDKTQVYVTDETKPEEVISNQIDTVSEPFLDNKSLVTTKKKCKSKGTVVKTIILIFLIFILLFLIYEVYRYMDGRDSTKLTEKIVSEIEIDDVDEVQEDMKSLYKLNHDLVGFLLIPDTKIKYPVVYTAGKDYYINKDFNKKPSLGGTLYVDKHNTVSPRDTNLIIHGHNMYHDGTMFNGLHKFKDENFYLNHKTFTYYTLSEKEEYEIVSVFLSKVYLVTDQVFKYYQFYNADTVEDFDYYASNIKKLSMYKIDTDLEYGDELLTLSTCEYSQENGRLVIVAKKINNN